MSLEAFLHNLHFDVDKVAPPDWEVNWEDAPLKYKLYRGLPIFPLSSEVPLTLEGGKANAIPDLQQIGHFLWYVFGLAQICLTDQMPLYRRLVPSGGALYPSELYIYLKLKELPTGVYHYDVAHHRLVLLREGDFDRYLDRTLGNRCDLAHCFGAVFVSTVFWKNFFKYNNFAYRLQGLDAGVLLGQLLEATKRFGFETGVCFQFLDRAINHLLGLSDRKESVYAIAPLSVEPTSNWFFNRSNGAFEHVSASELCKELNEVRHEFYERSQKVLEYPMLIKINEASLLESTQSFQQIGKTNDSEFSCPEVPLPPVKRLSYDLVEVSIKRFSPAENFVLDKVSQLQLAELLQETFASFFYCNDLDGEKETPASRVSLYGCFYGVDDIPNGAYGYDSKNHALRLIRPGDHRFRLQQGMSMYTVNLSQVPCCFHAASELAHYKTSLGWRGYRIQQMEIGILVQKLLLAATALGMGGRPLLDFTTSLCNQIYNLNQGQQTTLIQIPVGHYRVRPLLEGTLFC